MWLSITPIGYCSAVFGHDHTFVELQWICLQASGPIPKNTSLIYDNRADIRELNTERVAQREAAADLCVEQNIFEVSLYTSYLLELLNLEKLGTVSDN